MKTMKEIRRSALALAIVLLAAQTGYAAVSADDARALGATLTKFGAEAQGNSDGSIPAYDGGLKNPPTVGKDRYPDPFAGEKPLYVVDGKNLAKYEAMLTPGTAEMLRRYPDYHLNVYPTHRTISYPDWFLENTVKNATTAKLEGEVEGDKVGGAAPDGYPFQGVPFPIPRNGLEVMWNNNLRFSPPVTLLRSRSWLVDTGGTPNELPGIQAAYMNPFSEQSGELRKKAHDSYFAFQTSLYSPSTSAGVQFLNFYKVDSAAPAPIWIYTPGQRRVRKAPEFAYDIPMSSYAGVLLWDEPWGFVGRMDRFDFKLVGKKELIVPYNVFGVTNQKTSEEVLGKSTVNPDAVRWEKRRVWVVEATRKNGVRHVYSKRNFYIEEDSWAMVSTESFDNAGKLWRVAYLYTFPAYNIGGLNNNTWSFNDLLKGNYTVINTGRNEPGNYVRSYQREEGLNIPFTPQAIAGGSVR
ncbi:DUF1329 domain-containing protein [Pseudomonas citronellolis]|uniref:DUF1329 domain-containing protein n=1 Tax=Pseudomonas citronellolis TaxID=53408 RepID=UPI002FDA16B5